MKMLKSKTMEMIEVYSGSFTKSSYIKSILEERGIKVLLKDELMGNIAPWYVAPGGVGAVKVVVPEDEANRAMAIIRDLVPSTTPRRSRRIIKALLIVLLILILVSGVA